MAWSAGRGNVPYLTKGQIKREAAVLLEEYGAAHGPVLAPPVPVDDILELHLGLEFGFQDLAALFGVGDVLGAIWFGEKAVRADKSLDPEVHPRQLGRFRFTLAHEAGHWRLHRRHYARDPRQSEMFGDVPTPSFVCRSADAKLPVEWQADYFAAHLLMPTPLLRAAWEAWRGNPYPVAVPDLLTPGPADADVPAVVRQFLRPLADVFQVSAEAMRIRLTELELLTDGRTNPLFS